MGISHHALRCFLNDKVPIRTREWTLSRIEGGLRWTSVPPDAVMYWLGQDLAWLRDLTWADREEILSLVARRIEERKPPEVRPGG